MAFKKYGLFKGRARRKEYWMFFLINSIINLTLIVTGYEFYDTGIEILSLLFYVLYILYTVFAFIPGVALFVRRLHDIDMPGISFLIGLIPFVGGIWLLVLMCTKGTIGPNSYGGDPKTMPIDRATNKVMNNENCSFCRLKIIEGEIVKVCPDCGLQFHQECWDENGILTAYFNKYGKIPQNDDTFDEYGILSAYWKKYGKLPQHSIYWTENKCCSTFGCVKNQKSKGEQ